MTKNKCIEIYIELKCSQLPSVVIELLPELLFVDFGWRKLVCSEINLMRLKFQLIQWNGKLKNHSLPRNLEGQIMLFTLFIFSEQTVKIFFDPSRTITMKSANSLKKTRCMYSPCNNNIPKRYTSSNNCMMCDFQSSSNSVALQRIF